MNKRKLKIGDVLQITQMEGRPEYIGLFLVVTEPKEWGAQGYLMSPYNFDGLVRYDGLAYLRVKFDDVEYVGKSPLILQSEEVKNG